MRQPFVDQRIELRVTEAPPPPLDRPGARLIGQSRLRIERGGGDRHGLLPEIGDARTARQQAENRGIEEK